jgi:hypothetical protein
MDLNTLAAILKDQARKDSLIVLDGSVLTEEAMRQKIRAAFALDKTADLTIANVEPDNIPEPDPDGVLRISTGKASLLNQAAVPVALAFTATNGRVDVVIVAKMSDTWTFKDSFKGLDTFPFTWLKISKAHFVFSTVASAYAWPDEATTTIPLAAGKLTFLSQVAPKYFSSIPSQVRELIGDVTRKFYGSLTPEDGQNWPYGILRAPLSDARFEIGGDAIKLGLGAPKLAVRIGEATEDYPVQPLDLFVEGEFRVGPGDENALLVDVGMPVSAGGAIEVSATPIDPGASVAALIKELPGGNFIQYIPAELSTLNLFDKVGLNNFSLIVTSEPKVTYLGLSVGSTKSWELIPTLLKLDDLSLNLETLEPSNLNSMRARISARAQFFKQIFPDHFTFNIELEKEASSWTVKTMNGAYYSSVSLSTIVTAILPRDVTVPRELEHIKFFDFGLNIHKGTGRHNYGFYGSVETAFPILGHQFISSLNIAVTEIDGSKTLEIRGGLVIGEQVFSLDLKLGKDGSQLVASWENQGTPLGFAEIAGALGWNSMPPLPEGLDLGLKQAKIIYDFKKSVVVTAKSRNYGDVVFASLLRNDKQVYFFAVDVPLDVKFSKLPLVGDSLRTDKPVGIDNLQIIVTSEKFDENETKELNQIIGTQLMPKLLDKGLTFAAKLEMNGAHEVVLPVTAGRRPPQAKQLTAPAASTDGNYQAEPKWIELNKTFGPVHFDKVGVQYQASTLRFLLNAALSVAGLTLSVEGLSVGSSLKKFKPEFELRGLGIEYRNDAVEIGGAFVRTVVAGKPDRYDGAAVIKTKQFALSAIGSYTTIDDREPSLFIYAFLDYPLGGPAFFFVTGLAAGFGYNRKLIAPSVDKVADFPLVKQAVGLEPKPQGVMAALRSLQEYVPPTVGSVFLALGVRFNSFKLVDSFALLTIEFGNNLAINLIGLSKAVVPTPVGKNPPTPLAQVEIAWKATYNPDDGCLGIDARLTSNSYILSKDCHLSGGFAFYSWFTGPNAGDFVQTLGGYHPKFKVPAHYPKVPRLAFDWRVSNSLTIQGDAYYALTGSALMAGGHLEVLFREGGLRAWLKLGADFLIAWKPYHYDASIYVNVGASYTFDINLLFTRVRVTISVDVGAQLHLWGPDFSGTATIDLSVISFTIAFGAGASQAPEPLKTWEEFQESFLPREKDVCTISVKSGLVRNIQAKDKEPERWVINPKQFSLVIDSAIPLKSVPVVGKKLDANTDFGIAPMAVTKRQQPPPSPAPKQKQFTDSNLTIALTKNGSGVNDIEFKYSLVKKLVPAGLWGESATPKLNGEKFLADVATGIEITPGNPPASHGTKKLDVAVFEFAPEPHPDAFKWELPSSFKREKEPDPRARIARSVGRNPNRDALKAELGLKFDISIGKDFAGDFVTAPQIGTLELCQPK